ncbi:MAG: hypothetical protein ACP5JK_01135 [Candidatus Aenigmatarchaeota archaeon]
MLGMLKGAVKIRGKNRIETFENIFVIVLVLSSISLSIFIGISGIFPKGWPVIGIMLSSFFVFISIISLILIWIIKEVK